MPPMPANMPGEGAKMFIVGKPDPAEPELAGPELAAVEPILEAAE